MIASSDIEQKHDDQTTKKRHHKKVTVRLVPIWLRLIIIAFLLFLSVTIGTMIGYGVLGDGHPLDVLKKSTWQQIVNLVVGE